MFKYIDKPDLPQEIIDQIRLIILQHESNAGLEEFQNNQLDSNIITQLEKCYSDNKTGLGLDFDTAYQYSGLASFTIIKVQGPVLDWVLKNIDNNIDGLHIQVIKGEYVFPHVDALRTNAWNYIIDSGDADTCFYEPKAEFSNLPLYPVTYVPYDRVNKIQTYKIESKRWHCLDVSKMHGVENIKSIRIALSISFVR
jgi:hypothetical protein